MNEQTNDIQSQTLPEVSPAGRLEGVAPGSVLCFGEVMVRLSLPGDTTWLHQQQLHANLAGAECNVAVALAKWGVPVNYCTALPAGPVSTDILTFLQEKNINTSLVQFSGSRVGIMYVMHGSDSREGGVVYDRRYSSFGELLPGMVNWDEVLQGVGWFHFTAISPALSENTTAVCMEAVLAAKKLGLTVSIDLNHRPTLWKYGKTPVEVVPKLAAHCDIIMGNIWSANTLLGIPLHSNLIAENTRAAFLVHAEQTSIGIQQQFTNCKKVALTFRFNTPQGGIHYYGSLYTGSQLFASGDFTAPSIADKIGSGDCFMAALIFALRNGYAPEATVEFAAAAAFGKLQEKGDFTNHTTDNINNIIKHHAYAI